MLKNQERKKKKSQFAEREGLTKQRSKYWSKMTFAYSTDFWTRMAESTSWLQILRTYVAEEALKKTQRPVFSPRSSDRLGCFFNNGL